MDELKKLLCVVPCLLRKCAAAMLSDDTHVAELLPVILPWQPACHSEVSHLLQCVKIEMPISLITPPSDVVVAGREAYWAGHLKM